MRLIEGYRKGERDPDMVKSIRGEYLEAIRKCYGKARKKDKKPILEEFCSNCSYHRKYGILLLGLRPRLRVKKPGARPIYGSDALPVPLKHIRLATALTSKIISVTFLNAATRCTRQSLGCPDSEFSDASGTLTQREEGCEAVCDS